MTNSSTVPFFDLSRQHHRLRREIDDAIARVINANWFILGAELERFEADFARYCGVKRCVGVGNGLDALTLALEALDIGAGDEVILPANTFIASALAVLRAGATPVLVDVNPETLSIDPGAVEKAITPRTKGVMPVHLFGRLADMPALIEIARKHRLHLIEDAAQAHGASLAGRKAGAMGTIGCFSFYPTKNLGALGDAGAIVTDDDDLADRIARRRNYGEQRKYTHSEIGANSRLDPIQAAVLSAKLVHLDHWNDARRALAERYIDDLEPLGIEIKAKPRSQRGSDHVHHLFVIETSDRDKVRTRLLEQGIQTAIHYPIPLHRQPALQGRFLNRSSFPHADRSSTRLLSLPIFPEMTDQEQRRAIDALKSIQS